MLVSSKSPKDMERAQAAFHKKEAQQREGQVAMAEYNAASTAMRAKTERLKALRPIDYTGLAARLAREI